MSGSAKTQAEVEQSLARSEPIPCGAEEPAKDCTGLVWHICMGVCDNCFRAAYAAFRKAWGWPL